jgi:hypothetical protein
MHGPAVVKYLSVGQEELYIGFVQAMAEAVKSDSRSCGERSQCKSPHRNMHSGANLHTCHRMPCCCWASSAARWLTLRRCKAVSCHCVSKPKVPAANIVPVHHITGFKLAGNPFSADTEQLSQWLLTACNCGFLHHVGHDMHTSKAQQHRAAPLFCQQDVVDLCNEKKN